MTTQLPPTDGLWQVWIAGQFYCEGSELAMRQSLRLYQSRGKQARLRLPSGAWEDGE